MRFKANLEVIKKSIESFVEDNKPRSRKQQDGENIQKLLEGYEVINCVNNYKAGYLMILWYYCYRKN